MKKTKIAFIMFMLLLTAVFFELQSSSIRYNQEVIIMVENIEQAQMYESTYHLTLQRLSPSGIARFLTTKQTDLGELLETGFTLNHTTEVFRPPWQKTEDPYLKDQYALAMMQTPDAWNITLGSSNVVVAIIDTGIDTNHDEFANRISPLSYNSHSETVGLAAVKDDNGHGTMVAGVIAATKDNSKGIAGIAQNIQLLIIKANSPNQGSFLDSALIEGIYYAANNGADIINMSLGGTTANPLVENAINYAVSKGIIIVAAAGNDGNDSLFYPAAFEHVIAVSAVDKNRAIATYSNYGTHIDLAAPGSDIVTTSINNGYVTTSGTSLAAPQVTGVLALLKSHFIDLSYDAYITKLLSTAVDEGETGKDINYGYGIVNTYRSLSIEFVQFTFETYGADPIEPILVQKGQTTSLPQPTLANHVFSGWYFDDAFTIPWTDFETIPNHDALLYAKFDSTQITLSFMIGTNLFDQFVIERGTTTTLPTISREGFYFIGWTFDVDNLSGYDGSEFMVDTILYAHFEEIKYITVYLYYLDQLLEERIYIEGDTVQLSEIPIDGFDFYGWYQDTELMTPFETTQLEIDTTLYGDYRTKSFIISFETFGGLPIDDIIVLYQDIIQLPVAIKYDDEFLGWYTDQALVNEYQNGPILNNMTLYAKFVETAYTVTYMIDDEVYLIKKAEANQIITTIDPKIIGFYFDGWYVDQALSIAYISEPILGDIVLYGTFEERFQLVRFYNFDLETVIDVIYVPYGGTFESPEGPTRPSTSSFDFKFSRWNTESEPTFEDLDIYPIYLMKFNPQSIIFHPNVDTITVNDNWVDKGLTLLDSTLHYLVIADIDLSTPGMYEIIYDIYKNDLKIYSVSKYVFVLEDINNVDLTLNPGTDTIKIGETHIDTGLKNIDSSKIEIISNINNNEVGVYEIIYYYQKNGFTYKISRYVHVIDDTHISDAGPLQLAIIKRKDEVYENIL
jgi:hypothetical protein